MSEYCRVCETRETCREICPALHRHLNRSCGYVYGYRYLDPKTGLPILKLRKQIIESGVPWVKTPWEAMDVAKGGKAIYKPKVVASDAFLNEIPQSWEGYAVSGLSDLENKLRYYREVEQLGWSAIAEILGDSKTALRKSYERARSKYIESLKLSQKHIKLEQEQEVGHDPHS